MSEPLSKPYKFSEHPVVEALIGKQVEILKEILESAYLTPPPCPTCDPPQRVLITCTTSGRTPEELEELRKELQDMVDSKKPLVVYGETPEEYPEPEDGVKIDASTLGKVSALVISEVGDRIFRRAIVEAQEAARHGEVQVEINHPLNWGLSSYLGPKFRNLGFEFMPFSRSKESGSGFILNWQASIIGLAEKPQS